MGEKSTKLETDKETSINTLRQRVAAFVHERDWEQFHKPKDLSMSIAIEAAELMEIFQWKTHEELSRMSEKDLSHVREEIADVIIYSFSLSNSLGIDLTSAILDKIMKNELKYPVSKAKGSSKKYTEL